MPLLRKPAEDAPQPSMPSAIAALGRRREVAAGTVLFLQDDPAECCFFLERGEVALRRLSPKGDEVEIARIGEGEWFGEAVLFAGRIFPAKAAAVKKSTLVEFRRAALLSSPDPEITSFFLALLARKCLFLNGRIEQLTTRDARERVAGFLIGLCPGARAGCEGGRSPCSFPLPKKKREIAIELGMSPETFSRALRRLEDEGIIAIEGSELRVPSCERLRSLVGD